MRFVVLHYHILKNAGSTIEEILDHSFGGSFHRIDTQDREGHYSNSSLLSFLNHHPHLRAVSSHQIRHPVPTAPGFIFFDLCFLRDPIDRVRSMYDYFRQKPAEGDPVSELANQLGLGEFVRRLIDRVPSMVNDAQVALVANGGADDYPPGADDFRRAAGRILNTSFLGVVDRFNESLIAGQHLLRTVFPHLDCAQAPVNVSRGLSRTLAARKRQLREACGGAVYAELLKLNAWDLRLVGLARGEVRRRLELVPGHAVRVAALKNRVQALAADSPGAADQGPPDGDAKCVVGMNSQRHFGSGGGACPSGEVPPRAESTSPRAHAASANDGGRGSLRALKRLFRILPALRLLRPLFDADYYRACHPEIAASRMNPLVHFILAGARKNWQPHPLFDTGFYLRAYPDVAAAGVDPLYHYMARGAAEVRQPHPLFDPAYYLAHNPDVRDIRMNPLVHYVLHGASEGRKPNPLFEPDYYRSHSPELRRTSGNPLVDFLRNWETNQANPHPLFDCEYYLRGNPEAARQGINPLVHYLLSERCGEGATGADAPCLECTRAVTGADSFPVVQLDIEDAMVAVVFLEPAFDSKTVAERQRVYRSMRSYALRAGLAGHLVMVWQDPAGRIRFMAPIEQHPFFQSLGFDQLRAQTDHTLACG